jgi:hypothetical protein
MKLTTNADYDTRCVVLFDTVGVITAVAALARAEPEVSGSETPPAGDCSAIEINETALLRGQT